MKYVCIVDDEAQVRKSLSNLLRSAGYQTHCFASGEAFLDSPCRAYATALLLDMQLSGLQGAEVLRHLHIANVALPVICMSADGSKQMSQSALQNGAHSFVAKPFKAEALLALLASLPETAS